MQVLAIWWRGRDLMGLIQVLPTPAGKLVQQLYEAGGAVGASIRGWSSYTAHMPGCSQACSVPCGDVQLVMQAVELIA